MKPETIFLRKASGLARDWSLGDYTIYNAFNPIVWGIYVVAFSAFWTSSNFLLGYALIFVFGTFQAIVYAGMTSAMPRAGGDYVFQTRVFGRFRVAGYVMCWVVYAVGFPMSLILICTPIVWRYITPLALLAGMSYDSVVFWSSKSGLFLSFVIQMIIGLTLTCLGLKWIGRIQKIVYLLSMIGLFLIPLSFLSVSKEFFATNFNAFYHNVLGTSTTVFQDTVQAATAAGWAATFNWNILENLPMMALMAMGGAWFTQGNPLGGEARGASSFKSAFIAYEIGNIVSSLIPILVLWPVINAIGFQFFQAQNYLFFVGDVAHAPIYPELSLWVYFATGNKLLSVFIITMALLVTFQVNILLNGFLNCSRPLFAMAFDRMLPSAFAKLSTRHRLPLVAYGYIAAAALVFGLLYAFDVGHFISLTLDVLALTLVTFMATAVAALALPYAKRDIYESSPIAKYSWGKLNLLAISAIIYLAYFGIILYYWATDARYGVNSAYSLVFMSGFYIIAAILYVAFKYYNKRRGVDIGLTYGEIPAE